MADRYNNNLNRHFNNYFSAIDIHFGNFIGEQAPGNKDYLFLAAALASRYVRCGHICLDLNSLAGGSIASSEAVEGPVTCPELEVWLRALKSSCAVGRPGDFKPLILDNNNRLYLQRYWRYEQDIAQNILCRISTIAETKFDKADIGAKLRLYFPESKKQEPHWQKVAATAALLKKFLVISGSPGTGKTTTITKIMALLLEVTREKLRIALAAPTGKAAARLQDSVQKTKAKLLCADSTKELIPDNAQTVHRLLGTISKSPYFKFNENNRLPCDLVVIDEASMVDVPLLAKLLQALPPEARIILLGDKDQLASVEAGAALGDICYPDSVNKYSEKFAAIINDLSGERVPVQAAAKAVQDSIIQLQTNFRFTEQSGINILSRSVKTGNFRDALHLLQNGEHADVEWFNLDLPDSANAQFSADVIDGYAAYLQTLNTGADLHKIFGYFEQFRILCALRVGNWGTRKVNAYVEKILQGAGLIKPTGSFYAGMPVMILQNDYNLQLFNGDVGIIMKEKTGDQSLWAFFRNEQGKLRKINPARLPELETVWAMTVHKSQGSEFDRIMLILSEHDFPVITRELIYTGITRARRLVRIWAGQEVLAKAVSRRISRQSGLSAAIENEKERDLP